MEIIVTHKGADFDALASLIAGTILYPDAVAVLPGSINPNLKMFLSIHKDIFNFACIKDIKFHEVKTLIVVDTNSWNRLEPMPIKKNDIKIILWDHHTGGNIDADYKVYKEIGANITLMINQLKKQKKDITPIQASLFLMGLYEDTGNLSFPSTTAQDAYAAAYLLEKKADLLIISNFLRNAYGKKQKEILFFMIQNAKRQEIANFNISISIMEIQGQIQNLSMVVQMYKEIVNVDAAFGIFIDNARNKCMVIGRSNIEELNIGLIMKSIGGGGHPGAGAALLNKTNPHVVEEMIIDRIKGNQQSSVLLSDIMSYPVLTINQDITIEKAGKILRENEYIGVPVVNENEKMVGIISTRDFKKVKKANQIKSPVKAFMTRNIISISKNKSIMDVSKLMIKYDIGRIPVIENEKIIGIVARSDIMLYFYDLLPD